MPYDDLMRCTVTFFAWVCLAAASCASTDTTITSYRDPDFQDRTFQNLLVAVDRTSLDWRNAIENSVVGVLADSRTRAVRGTQVLRPTRQYTPDEIAERLRQEGFDGLLWIDFVAQQAEHEYVPARTHAYHGIYTTDVYSHGGYFVSYPVVRFEIRLEDSASRRNAWIASAVTRGTSDAEPADLAKSLAEALVDRLRDDGLIARSVASQSTANREP